MHFPRPFNTSELIFMQKLLATLLKRKSFYANIATEAETLDWMLSFAETHKKVIGLVHTFPPPGRYESYFASHFFLYPLTIFFFTLSTASVFQGSGPDILNLLTPHATPSPSQPIFGDRLLRLHKSDGTIR